MTRQIETFEPLNVLPVSGWGAAYWELPHDGLARVWVYPVPFMGVTVVTTNYYADDGPREVRPAEKRREICGWEYDTEGGMGFVCCQDGGNFGGYVPPGGDPRAATCYLRGHEVGEIKRRGSEFANPDEWPDPCNRPNSMSARPADAEL